MITLDSERVKVSAIIWAIRAPCQNRTVLIMSLAGRVAITQSLFPTNLHERPKNEGYAATGKHSSMVVVFRFRWRSDSGGRSYFVSPSCWSDNASGTRQKFLFERKNSAPGTESAHCLTCGLAIVSITRTIVSKIGSSKKNARLTVIHLEICMCVEPAVYKSSFFPDL